MNYGGMILKDFDRVHGLMLAEFIRQVAVENPEKATAFHEAFNQGLYSFRFHTVYTPGRSGVVSCELIEGDGKETNLFKITMPGGN